MTQHNATPFDFAQRMIGEVVEIPGKAHAPFIQWCFESCNGYGSDTPDEVPWCSAFANRVAWIFRLPRSKSAAARSWLLVGTPVALADARVGYDVVILKRGGGGQPGPEVTSGAPGHVAFFAGVDRVDAPSMVSVVGGNQSNGVTVASFPVERVLGVRRLLWAS